MRTLLTVNPPPSPPCEVCTAQPGQQVTTRVGPLLVVTTAPCYVAYRIGGLAFAVTCSASITNTAEHPIVLAAENQQIIGTPHLPRVLPQAKARGLKGAIGRLPSTMTETRFTIDMIGPMRLDPGQTVTLPPPPADTVWVVVDIDPEAIQRASWIAGGVAVVVAGAAAYGVVRGAQAIARRARRR